MRVTNKLYMFFIFFLLWLVVYGLTSFRQSQSLADHIEQETFKMQCRVDCRIKKIDQGHFVPVKCRDYCKN